MLRSHTLVGREGRNRFLAHKYTENGAMDSLPAKHSCLGWLYLCIFKRETGAVVPNGDFLLAGIKGAGSGLKRRGLTHPRFPCHLQVSGTTYVP